MFDPTVAILFATIFAIVAISLGYAGFKQWLQHREKIDNSTELAALKRVVEEAEAERNALKQRIQHLETIVTAEYDVGKDSLGTAPEMDPSNLRTTEPASESSPTPQQQRTR